MEALHYLVIFDTRRVPAAGHDTVQFCVAVNDHFNPRLYNVISFLLSYAGPLAVMAVVYVRISLELWRSSGIVSSVGDGGDRATHIELQERSTTAAGGTCDVEAAGSLDEMQSVTTQPPRRRRWYLLASSGGEQTRLTNNAELVSGRRKVIRLLVAVVASFAVCVLPYHVRVLWQTFAEPHVIDDWQLVIPPLTFVVYYLNSAVNPLLYAFLSDRFRTSFVDVLRGRCSQRSQTATAVTRWATARSVRTCTAPAV